MPCISVFVQYCAIGKVDDICHIMHECACLGDYHYFGLLGVQCGGDSS